MTDGVDVIVDKHRMEVGNSSMVESTKRTGNCNN